MFQGDQLSIHISTYTNMSAHTCAHPHIHTRYHDTAHTTPISPYCAYYTDITILRILHRYHDTAHTTPISRYCAPVHSVEHCRPRCCRLSRPPEPLPCAFDERSAGAFWLLEDVQNGVGSGCTESSHVEAEDSHDRMAIMVKIPAGSAEGGISSKSYRSVCCSKGSGCNNLTWGSK
jgi:hypothetical protein